ncbi:putative regulator of septum formation [Haloactinopolyspora alba]|uniref:Putative regulator of septum formation n=1 Tax=Haloactinopolyspora alba TaxID=648780 RepID=A0A2P8E3Y9_9ACTN|nr:septum formation family protein [Haloactinopolyspora alba]PSL04188.1 putative regulator of septum formation [Haloactinopolyspora alba]
MKSTIRTTIAALGAVAAISLSGCGSDDESGGGNETAAASESANGGTETAAADDGAPATETADVFDVGLGDCIGSFATDSEVSNVAKAPCDEKHEQEVFAVTKAPDGEFPGSDAFQKQVEKDCIPEFKSFVGMSYQESELEVQWLEPTEESWAQGDREIVCTVLDPAGPVTGTLEGANR